MIIHHLEQKYNVTYVRTQNLYICLIERQTYHSNWYVIYKNEQI